MKHVLTFRYQSKSCMLGMQAGADRESLFGALSFFLRSVTKGAHVSNSCLQVIRRLKNNKGTETTGTSQALPRHLEHQEQR